ncbi:MAG: response regulator [Pseudomonadota bacterium]
MQIDKKRILIVDDSAGDIHVLMENLKSEFAVLAATSGEKALALARKEPCPDVILMDVDMPGMSGYEACQRLKATPECRDIDVIFVTAHDTTEEKLSGYAAGGSDYLIKPVQPTELLQKVRLAVKHRMERMSAAADKAVAVQTAMTAISSAGEQGVVIDFLRRSFSVDNLRDLADLVAETITHYGLDGSLQVRGGRDLIYASAHGEPSPLEQELLSRLKDAGRIRQNGERLVLNFGDISLLIKNMPADEDKSGRLRDHLALLLEGAQARLRALELEREVARVVADSRQALQVIENLQHRQKKDAMAIMDGVMKDLEASFLSYGLTEEQEATLINVVQRGVDKSLDNFEQGLKIDAQMRAIIDRLSQVGKR